MMGLLLHTVSKLRNLAHIRTLLLGLCAITLLPGCRWFTQQSPVTITAYDDSAVQRQYLLDRFKDDWYWLIEGDCDILPMIDQRVTWSGYTDVHIDLARYDGQLAGFTVYYKKSAQRGLFQFLDVAPEFRGKGVSDALIEHALRELKKMGCASAELITRVQNVKAQKLYIKHGFHFLYNDGKMLHFEKNL